MESGIKVSDDSFQAEVIERSKEVPVVVDFWAPWCGPCLMLSPLLEKLAEEHAGKFVLAKVNVDESKEKAVEYGVSAIPDVLMFRGGKVVDGFMGMKAEKVVREWLEKNL
jgi:thioredoxin